MDTYLAEYLSRHKDELEKHYVWGFNETVPQERFRFTFSGATPFEKTLELKGQLCKAASATSSIEEKLPFAEYFIKDWGGIRNFSKVKEVVKNFDSLASSSQRPTQHRFPFENISSWSKWLSIICPDWALIYDARVAYSLNAINFMRGSPSKVFPMPTGRNTTMKLLDASTLALTARVRHSEKRIAKAIKLQHFWREDEVYETYVEAVSNAHRLLWPEGTPIAHTEMLLFSLADTVVFNDLVASVARA